ncbi:MAG TPA: acyl-CoA dehydratase activase [Terriglobia bacterium]|nr:acyl-CoA dehydratase activase [Terriglobia bacterium]
MGVIIGLDIGGVSAKLAAIGGPTDGPLFASLAEKSEWFFSRMCPENSSMRGRPLLLSRHRRVAGNPSQAAMDLLNEFHSSIPKHRLAGLRVTGSGALLISSLLECREENEFRAIASGIHLFHPEVRTVFEMGGQTSKYLRIEGMAGSDRIGIVDYQASGECAAGTGSFIDQQAARLRYSIEDVGPAACSATCAARIAGRCSVFAKTDMIHAQQKGYSTEQVLRGLCEAVARNFKSSIVKGRPVVAPVAFIGGVALNEGVRNAMRDIFRLAEQDFIVPELYIWMGAIGAALLEAENLARPLPKRTRVQPRPDLGESPAHSRPLSLANVLILRDHTGLIGAPRRGEVVRAYLGVDVGSVSTNLVAIDSAGKVLKEIYLYTEGRPIEIVTRGLKEIAAHLGASIEVCGVGTTGSGRELIGELIGADTVNDEITAHKTGAMFVSEQLGTGPVDTIFEIGGQDSKFIRIENGVVIDFTMNEACAAGTGSFLEEQAARMGISIKGEFACLALTSSSPANLGERCTVFMERDVMALLLKGAKVGDLAAGLAYSVVLNYLNRVVRGRKIGDVIYFQGGTAYNDAVAAAFSQVLGKRIIVPPHNGVIGAIGAALIARDRMQGTVRPSRFRGYDLGRVKFTSRDFVCRACSNYCDIKEFTIEGQKTYWGDQCSDKFRKPAHSDRRPVIDDLIAYRESLLNSAATAATKSRRCVGIPRAMFFYDTFPFWNAWLRALDFDVVVSFPTDRKTAAAGAEMAIAQPCFPIQVAHGHVRELVSKQVDFILLPNIVNAEAPKSSVPSHLCPWNQTLPFVVRVAPQLEGFRGEVLVPTVHFRNGQDFVQKELVQFARELGVPSQRARLAVRAAFTAQREFASALLRAGKRALDTLRQTGEPGVILVGRPYNIYDGSVNCDIPRKLRKLYGINVVPMDFLPLDQEDIAGVNDNMFWNSGRRILAAAQIARRFANLHLIYISNFKCGPDSFIKSFLNEAAGKPSLVLQFDGHSNDAGFITRCEAYLESKGILRCSSVTAAV